MIPGTNKPVFCSVHQLSTVIIESMRSGCRLNFSSVVAPVLSVILVINSIRTDNVVAVLLGRCTAASDTSQGSGSQQHVLQ